MGWDAVHGLPVHAEEAVRRVYLAVEVDEMLLHPAELSFGVNVKAKPLRGRAKPIGVVFKPRCAGPLDKFRKWLKLAHGSSLRPIAVPKRIGTSPDLGTGSFFFAVDCCAATHGAEWPPK
jgi:hypothetical protein